MFYCEKNCVILGGWKTVGTNDILIILFILGLSCLFLSAKCSGGLGYHGLGSFVLGMKVWKFSNKIFGYLLISFSLLLWIFSSLQLVEAIPFQTLTGILVLFSIGITEILTFRKFQNWK